MKTGPKPKPIEERFWAKVEKRANGCWEWTANKNNQGYGLIRTGSLSDGSRRMELAHRVSLKISGIHIPDGYDVDHLCKNTICVNPSHLEPVTTEENLRRGNILLYHEKRKTFTHCRYGHEYAGNTFIGKDGYRRCRECARIKSKRHRDRYKKP